jgi:hypothetical protein
MMDRNAELERIRLYAAATRQRIHRLDVLLDDQARILNLDPLLKTDGKQSFTLFDIQVYSVTFLLASTGGFLAGFWTARFR